MTFVCAFVMMLSVTQLIDAQPAAAATFEYEVFPGTSIPDNGCPTNLDTIINVPATFNVGDVNVAIAIDHTWRSDLEVSITSPAGTTVDLFADVGSFADDVDALFDDDEPTDAGDMTGDHDAASPYEDFAFNPQGSAVLSAFKRRSCKR